MPYNKSKFARNVQLTGGGGSATSSYYGFDGTPFQQRTTNIVYTKTDVVYMTYVNDPAWRAFRSANGYLPTRYMTVRRVTGSQDLVTYDVGPVGGEYHRCRLAGFSGVGYSPGSAAPNFTSEGTNHWTVDKSRKKALLKARDLKASVPVIFAEGRKTVQMIAETAKKLAEAYSQFRKGNFRRVADLLGIFGSKGPSNNWLSYQYGWSPLIKDLTGLAELAAQQLELGGRKPRFTVSSSTRTTLSPFTTGYGGNDGFNGYGGYTESLRTWSSPEVIGKAWLLLEVQYSDAALASQLGFGGFFDIASVAWELVPFSFVFDWFVDVANTLEAMSALKGLTVLTGGCAIQQRTTDVKYVSRQYYSSSNFPHTKGPVWKGTEMSYERAPWDGGVPSGLILTNVYDALGARRIISAVALALQR